MKKIVPSKLSNEVFPLFNKDSSFSLTLKGTLNYTRKTADGEVTLSFPTDKVADEIPSIALMMRAFYASLIIASEQGRSTITFTKSHKLRKMFYLNRRIRRGGKIFKELEVAEKALRYTSFSWKNNKNGKGYKESVFRPLYSELKIDGSGKSVVFKVTLDTDHIQNINLLTGEVTGQFVILPLEYVFDRGILNYERNIRAKALEYFDLPILEIYGSKLLRWACLPGSLELRKSEREKMFSEIRRILSEMGFKLGKIRTKKGKIIDTAQDYREMKFTFFPPRTERKSGRVLGLRISPEEKKFIDYFVEWQESKNSILTREKIREEISNTVKAYGLDYCIEIFEASNHPMKFWIEIKRIKGTYDYKEYHG